MGDLKTDGLEKICRRLAWERTFNVSMEGESFRNAVMQNGSDSEPDLFDWYELVTEHEVCRTTMMPTVDGEGVVEVPGVFLVHPELPFVSATLDGLTLDRTVQGKCPQFNAYMDVLERFQAPQPWKVNPVPSEYRWQCRWEMWVAGIRQCDFVVWHPYPQGIIVPFSVTDDEIQQMHRRALLVENRIEEWMEKLAKQRRS